MWQSISTNVNKQRNLEVAVVEYAEYDTVFN
jgi:hypothetical protein